MGILTEAYMGIANIKDNIQVLEVPTHPKAIRLLEFWNERAVDGIVIGRDVPSRKIADLLSHISIGEPIEGGTDFRIRLAGSSLSAASVARSPV